MSVLGIILALAGAFVLGLASLSFSGLLSGLLIGYLFGWVGDLSRSNRQLRQRLEKLESSGPLTAPPAESGAESGAKPSVEPPAAPAAAVTEVPPPPVPPPTREPAQQVAAPETTPAPAAAMRKSGAAGPTLLDTVLGAIRRFFTDGNVVVRVGLLVLFFGVAFLLKYAVENDMLSIELRLLGAALGGLVLLILGWRARRKRGTFALLLQGGGVGIMYLTVFAAAKMYTLVPLEMAFPLMVALVVLSTALALLQDARSLALFGAAGGFLAPILLSSGDNNYIVLFSYYTLLNVGILSVAWYRSWRELNLLGFLFTFGISALWGMTRYEPEFFATTEPFLVIFFLMYVAISILFAFRQPEGYRGYVDGTLVFGTPIISAALQGGLVYHYEYGMAISALVMALFYIVLARLLWSRGSEATRRIMRLLTESFLAMAVVFGTLAIPLALDGRWSSAAWAMEGAALVWLGVRQHRWLARNFGLLLQLAAGVFYAEGHAGNFDSMALTPPPLWNGAFLGGLLISLSAFFSGWYLYRRRDQLRVFEGFTHAVMFAWGMLWWFGTTLNEVEVQVSTHYELLAAMLTVTASIALLTWLAQRLRWPLLHYPVLFQVGALYLFTLLSIFDHEHFFADLGYAFWLPAFALTAWMLHRAEDLRFRPWTLHAQHLAGFILLVFFACVELDWTAGHYLSGTLATVVWGLLPLLAMYLPRVSAVAGRWPVAQHRPAWQGVGTLVMLGWAWLWALLTMFFSSGQIYVIPYVPVINPLELTHLAIIVGALLWFLRGQRESAERFGNYRMLFYGATGATAFLWLNTVVGRAVSHYADMYFDWDLLLTSSLFHSAISILWGVTALVLLIIAGRMAHRPLRIVALSLVTMTLVKLFFIDLAKREELEVIITFLVVGSIYVAAGYFSHLPAEKEQHS
ncbi:MAG TPA: DUF2339 domain-containing protein [Gammaproteobacteria bacterium]|nr:DUF2339 domain-containing protein [Gammaproteobacteria bacterium]